MDNLNHLRNVNKLFEKITEIIPPNLSARLKNELKLTIDVVQLWEDLIDLRNKPQKDSQGRLIGIRGRISGRESGDEPEGDPELDAAIQQRALDYAEIIEQYLIETNQQAGNIEQITRILLEEILRSETASSEEQHHIVAEE